MSQQDVATRAWGGASSMMYGRDPVTGLPKVAAVDGTSGGLIVTGEGGQPPHFVPHFERHFDSAGNLTAGSTFIGDVQDTGVTPVFSKLSAVAWSDKTGELTVKQSNDNSVWRTTMVKSHVANAGAEVVNHPIVARYWRIEYRNTDSTTATSVVVGSVAMA